jgi:hypothetical protein
MSCRDNILFNAVLTGQDLHLAWINIFPMIVDTDRIRNFGAFLETVICRSLEKKHIIVLKKQENQSEIEKWTKNQFQNKHNVHK